MDSRLPRVAVFIVKSDIEFFVWCVVKGRISISFVGATTGRPRSSRSQNAHPPVILFDCRDRRPRLSNVVTVQDAPSAMI